MENTKLIGLTVKQADRLTDWQGIYPVISGGKIVKIVDACDMGEYVTDGEQAWLPDYCDVCELPIDDNSGKNINRDAFDVCECA